MGRAETALEATRTRVLEQPSSPQRSKAACVEQYRTPLLATCVGQPSSAHCGLPLPQNCFERRHKPPQMALPEIRATSSNRRDHPTLSRRIHISSRMTRRGAAFSLASDAPQWCLAPAWGSPRRRTSAFCRAPCRTVLNGATSRLRWPSQRSEQPAATGEITPPSREEYTSAVG